MTEQDAVDSLANDDNLYRALLNNEIPCFPKFTQLKEIFTNTYKSFLRSYEFDDITDRVMTSFPGNFRHMIYELLAKGSIRVLERNYETSTYRELLVRYCYCCHMPCALIINLSCRLIRKHFLVESAQLYWNDHPSDRVYKGETIEEYVMLVVSKFDLSYLLRTQRGKDKQLWEASHYLEFVHRAKVFSDHSTHPYYSCVSEEMMVSKKRSIINIRINGPVNWRFELLGSKDDAPDLVRKFESKSHKEEKLDEHCILDFVYQETPSIDEYKQLLSKTKQASKLLVVVFAQDYTSVSFLRPNKEQTNFE